MHIFIPFIEYGHLLDAKSLYPSGRNKTHMCVQTITTQRVTQGPETVTS